MGVLCAFAMVSMCTCLPVALGFRREQLLELCIRGGKRETVHKGPLRVIRVGKDSGVRLEYFYIFNDVVSGRQS